MERPEVVGTEEGQGGESSVTWENNFGGETWTLNLESSLYLPLSIHLSLSICRYVPIFNILKHFITF